ncbi:MAG: hypothetical protein HOQ21_10005 [Dermatophilaceae bacterium]|nr:hypothetical protein [Dermatophilaceae bacterium]
MENLDPRVRRREISELGYLIHRVENPVYPCPAGCPHTTAMTVYEAAVRWMCGHTRDIPFLDASCYRGCCHNRTKKWNLEVMSA